MYLNFQIFLKSPKKILNVTKLVIIGKFMQPFMEMIKLLLINNIVMNNNWFENQFKTLCAYFLKYFFYNTFWYDFLYALDE